MLQDFLVAVAFCPHDGCANLAQAGTVPPAGAVKNESVFCPVNGECAAEQVGFGQCPPDFQFLANGDGALGADYLQFLNTCGRAALDGNKVCYKSDVKP